MGIKYQGNNLAQAFSIQVAKPIDVRAIVDTKSDLTTAATFGGYAYNGMTVVVAATGKPFILTDVDHITDEASWKEMAAMSDISGIAGGMTFIGVAHDEQAAGDKVVALPIGEDGATVNKYVASDKSSWTPGDFVIYGTKEFVYTTTGWVEIGDESAVTQLIEELRQQLEDDEETIATALNDLNDRVTSLEEGGGGGSVSKYVTVISADDGTHSATITAATHGCGTSPVVTAVYGGNQAMVDINTNVSGDVTITWSANTTVSAQSPIKIIII